MLLVAPLPREQMAKAEAAISNAAEVVIACHINPDGDTIGTMIALGLGLEQLGNRAALYSQIWRHWIFEREPQLQRRKSSHSLLRASTVLCLQKSTEDGKSRHPPTRYR